MTPELQKYYEDKTKICTLCNVEKKLTDFDKNSRYKEGLYKHCKKCHYQVYGRNSHFLRSYGITESEYNTIAESQNWKCKVCDQAHELIQFSRLVVDHCHKNGGVRGLICQGCNMALGNAKDNPEILRKLADYLDKYYG
jgi:hypothetical protein